MPRPKPKKEAEGGRPLDLALGAIGENGRIAGSASDQAGRTDQEGYRPDSASVKMPARLSPIMLDESTPDCRQNNATGP